MGCDDAYVDHATAGGIFRDDHVVELEQEGLLVMSSGHVDYPLTTQYVYIHHITRFLNYYTQEIRPTGTGWDVESHVWST